MRDVENVGSVPGSRTYTEEGNGNPLSCLENRRDRGAWWATVHGVERSRTRPTLHACTLVCNPAILVLDHSSCPLGFPQLFHLEIILSPFPGNFQSRRFCPCGFPWLPVHEGLQPRAARTPRGLRSPERKWCGCSELLQTSLAHRLYCLNYSMNFFSK